MNVPNGLYHRPDYVTITGGWHEENAGWHIPPNNTADAWHCATDLLFALGIPQYEDEVNLRWQNTLPYYRYTVADHDAGITVAMGSEKQGWMVQLSGKWWATRLPSKEVMQRWTKGSRRVTRFDYAITYQAENGNKSEAESLRDAAVRSRDDQNKNEPIWHKPYAQTQTQTHYAGSKRSERFLRVYDKQDLSDERVMYVRLEMQYNRKAAAAALAGYVAHGRGDVQGILEFMFADNLKYAPAELIYIYNRIDPAEVGKRLPDPPTDRQKWFYGMVRRSLQKWIAEDPMAVRLWMKIMMEEELKGEIPLD